MSSVTRAWPARRLDVIFPARMFRSALIGRWRPKTIKIKMDESGNCGRA
jgi:hypothetical protein